jgi:DNA processing protein
MNAGTGMYERERLARAFLLAASHPGDRNLTDLVWQYGPALAAELVAVGASWESDAAQAMRQCVKAGLRLLVPGDGEWPAALSNGPWTAPLGLWVRGGGWLDQLARRAVAVAGGVGPTPYGAAVAFGLGRRLAEGGWTVATLGRPGIDSAALRGAQQSPATAAPVALPLGRLIDPQPVAHRKLFSRVCRNGALISEHGANEPERFQRWDVRAQSRLLCRVTTALVLVEPDGHGWDSRIVRTAEDTGLPVMTVPGSVNSPESAFAHELFRTARARLVTGPDDVISELERHLRGAVQ